MTRSFTSNTAAFKARQRATNVFGSNDAPGPGEYAETNTSLQSIKLWSSAIQAFGTTERRFMQSHSVTAPSTPGPGQYPAKRQFWSKSSLHRIRGQFVAVKTQSLNAVFKSGTERQLDKELRHTIRENLPSAAQYRDNRGIGELSVQGGAPNNFLLLQN